MYDIAFLSKYGTYHSIPVVTKNMVGGNIVSNFYNVSDDGPSNIKSRSRKAETKIITKTWLMEKPNPDIRIKNIQEISDDQLSDRYRYQILGNIYWG